MRKLIILTAILIFFQSTSFAQNNSLTFKNNFFGWHFHKNEDKLKISEVADLMESNEQARSYLKSARSNYTLTTIIGTIGGALIGIPIGQSIAGADANWTLAAVGGALTIVSIPISVQATKQARNAVAAYNAGLKANSYRQREYKLGFTDNGVGLIINF